MGELEAALRAARERGRKLLVPYLTAWGASVAVTGLWLVLSAIFVRMAAHRWRRLLGAFTKRERGE